MRHRLTIDDTAHDVALVPAGDAYRIDIDGRTHTVALQGDRLTVDGTAIRAAVAVDGTRIFVHLDGRTIELVYVDPVQRYARHGSGSAEDVAKAPMPGVVIAVHTTAGSKVAKGETLVVIESMKLETAVKAWRDGTVAAVHVEKGQSFQRGTPLVTLEPAAEGG